MNNFFKKIRLPENAILFIDSVRSYPEIKLDFFPATIRGKSCEVGIKSRIVCTWWLMPSIAKKREVKHFLQVAHYIHL